VPTKAKSWEPAYSQVLNQNKIDRLQQGAHAVSRKSLTQQHCIKYSPQNCADNNHTTDD